MTMSMLVTQVRLPLTLTQALDKLVDQGMYTSKSDVIRDAIRKFILEKQMGSIPNTGNSVREIRKIRKKLSKEKFNLTEINKFSK